MTWTLEQEIEHCEQLTTADAPQWLAWLRELQHLREHRWEGVVLGELPPEEQERLKQAHLDGKTIQVRVERGWRDVDVPAWNVSCAYRVKREPAITWVTPTDEDCPCQCQVRDKDEDEWKDAELRVAAEADDKSWPFLAKAKGVSWQWWAQCRMDAAQRKEEKA